MKKKKIIVVFPNELSAHTLTQIDAYNAICRDYEVHAVRYPLAATSGADFVGFASIIDIPADRSADLERFEIMLLSMWTNRAKTRLFEKSAERYFWIYFGTGNFKHKLRFLIKFIIPGLIPAVGRAIIGAKERRLKPSEALVEAFSRIKPDLVIGHVSGFSTPDFDTIKAARALGVSTLFLQVGFDNLCLNGPITYVPDYMGVWGYQSAIWANKIQGVPKRKIARIGSAFGEALKKPCDSSAAAVRREFGLPGDKDIIFFAGDVRPSHELGNLKILDDAITSGELANCHIFYRPHPFRIVPRNEGNYFKMGFRNVTMDPTLEPRFRSYWTDQGIKASPRDPELLKNSYRHTRKIFSVAGIFVGQVTGFVLEAIFCGVPSVQISFVNRDNAVWAPRFDLANSSEFQWLPGVFLVFHPSEIVEQVRKAFSLAYDQEASKRLRHQMASFVHDDEDSYSERLGALARAIIECDPKSPYYHVNHPGVDASRGENIVDNLVDPIRRCTA